MNTFVMPIELISDILSYLPCSEKKDEAIDYLLDKTELKRNKSIFVATIREQKTHYEKGIIYSMDEFIKHENFKDGLDLYVAIRHIDISNAKIDKRFKFNEKIRSIKITDSTIYSYNLFDNLSECRSVELNNVESCQPMSLFKSLSGIAGSLKSLIFRNIIADCNYANKLNRRDKNMVFSNLDTLVLYKVQEFDTKILKNFHGNSFVELTLMNIRVNKTILGVHFIPNNNFDKLRIFDSDVASANLLDNLLPKTIEKMTLDNVVNNTYPIKIERTLTNITDLTVRNFNCLKSIKNCKFNNVDYTFKLKQAEQSEANEFIEDNNFENTENVVINFTFKSNNLLSTIKEPKTLVLYRWFGSFNLITATKNFDNLVKFHCNINSGILLNSKSLKHVSFNINHSDLSKFNCPNLESIDINYNKCYEINFNKFTKLKLIDIRHDFYKSLIINSKSIEEINLTVTDPDSGADITINCSNVSKIKISNCDFDKHEIKYNCPKLTKLLFKGSCNGTHTIANLPSLKCVSNTAHDLHTIIDTDLEDCVYNGWSNNMTFKKNVKRLETTIGRFNALQYVPLSIENCQIRGYNNKFNDTSAVYYNCTELSLFDEIIIDIVLIIKFPNIKNLKLNKCRIYESFVNIFDAFIKTKKVNVIIIDKVSVINDRTDNRIRDWTYN